MNDPRIENRRWQLIELNGQPVQPPAGREAPFSSSTPQSSA